MHAPTRKFEFGPVGEVNSRLFKIVDLGLVYDAQYAVAFAAMALRERVCNSSGEIGFDVGIFGLEEVQCHLLRGRSSGKWTSDTIPSNIFNDQISKSKFRGYFNVRSPRR